MESDKDRREYDHVVRGLQENLADLCRWLTDGAGVSVVKLRRCQHLARAFRGMLHAGVGGAELVKAMHPTPAVGRYPSDRAVRHIEKTEVFDRGWYAGPDGWVGRDAAEFAVAIRSGLHDRGGPGGKERLRGEAQAGLLQVPQASLNPDRQVTGTR